MCPPDPLSWMFVPPWWECCWKKMLSYQLSLWGAWANESCPAHVMPSLDGSPFCWLIHGVKRPGPLDPAGDNSEGPSQLPSFPCGQLSSLLGLLQSLTSSFAQSQFYSLLQWWYWKHYPRNSLHTNCHLSVSFWGKSNGNTAYLSKYAEPHWRQGKESGQVTQTYERTLPKSWFREWS